MRIVGFVEDLKELLRSRGVRPSYVRLKVLQYLLTEKTHPTAEEIYRALVSEIPTLSRASVYNALAVLSEAGIVQALTIERHESRYDAKVGEHGHFQCEVCGRLYDFTVDFGSMRHEALEGFLVKRRDLYFRGICPECQKGGESHGKSGQNATSR